MTLQEITAFLAVCQYGSFRQAAEHTYTTQPTVSWYISSLEKELGHPLFIRGRGQARVKLTDAGQIFLPQAKKFEALFRETSTLMEQGTFSKYSFSSVNSMTNLVAPYVNSYFQQKVADCSLILSSNQSPTIISNIENGLLDSGLVCRLPDSNRVDAFKIAEEELVFICRKEADYPDYVTMNSLSSSNLLVCRWSPEIDTWLRSLFPGKPFADLQTISDISYFFSEKNIWTIVPYSYFSYFNLEDDFRICQTDIPSPRRNFYLLSRVPHKEPYYSHLKSILIKCFRSMEGMTVVAQDN